ncbi:MAG: hypothetical protein K2O78_05305 [Muribaculaceae bacterium]|nr:hypothetical protein [Muribaculaceae bacterium]
MTPTAILSALRCTILLLNLTAAVFLIFCEPTPDNPRWYTAMLLSKTAAVCAILLLRFLWRRWYTDPLIQTLTR